MESRWRGANGDVGGEAGDEYALPCSFPMEFRMYWSRIGDIMGRKPMLLPKLMANIEKQDEADT